MKSDCTLQPLRGVGQNLLPALCVFLQLITRAQRAAAQVMHDQVCARTCISVWLFCTGCYCSKGHSICAATADGAVQNAGVEIPIAAPQSDHLLYGRGAGRQLLNSHVFAWQTTFASRKFSRSSSSRSMTTWLVLIGDITSAGTKSCKPKIWRYYLSACFTFVQECDNFYICTLNLTIITAVNWTSLYIFNLFSLAYKNKYSIFT